jgi:hypothetical protein
MVIIPCVRSVWHRGSREEHIRYRPIRYTAACQVHVWPVGHSLVKRLLEVKVYPRATLVNVSENTLVPWIEVDPWFGVTINPSVHFP